MLLRHLQLWGFIRRSGRRYDTMSSRFDCFNFAILGVGRLSTLYFGIVIGEGRQLKQHGSSLDALECARTFKKSIASENDGDKSGILARGWSNWF